MTRTRDQSPIVAQDIGVTHALWVRITCENLAKHLTIIQTEHWLSTNFHFPWAGWDPNEKDQHIDLTFQVKHSRFSNVSRDTVCNYRSSHDPATENVGGRRCVPAHDILDLALYGRRLGGRRQLEGYRCRVQPKTTPAGTISSKRHPPEPFLPVYLWFTNIQAVRIS